MVDNVEFEVEMGNVGDGWKPILRRLYDELESLGWDGNVGQVKEKFGGLRVYLHDPEGKFAASIDRAEKESFQTCEVCGTKEGVDLRGKYWVKSLCVNCDAESRKKTYTIQPAGVGSVSVQVPGSGDGGESGPK